MSLKVLIWNFAITIGISLILGQSGGQCHQESEIYERPHVLVTSPGSPERQEPSQQTLAQSIGGRIQIRLGFDPTTLQLFVTIVCAAGLQPRSPQQPRNPYCKLFLLPDRSEKSKRRTRTLAGKLNLNTYVHFMKWLVLIINHTP